MTWRWMGHKGCIVEGCDGKHYSMGYCCKHYKRWMRYGHTNKVKVHKPCRFFKDCGRMAHAKGLCHAHYRRLRSTGTVYDLWGRLDLKV